jgi:hypothetical protein
MVRERAGLEVQAHGVVAGIPEDPHQGLTEVAGAPCHQKFHDRERTKDGGQGETLLRIL